MRETGAKDGQHAHFASMRPTIEAILSPELRLSDLSNTQFYGKLMPEISGAHDASQASGVVSQRHYQEPVGSRRGSTFTWSAAKPEENCRRPYLNMEPLQPSDRAQLVVIKKRVAECLVRTSYFPCECWVQLNCHAQTHRSDGRRSSHSRCRRRTALLPSRLLRSSICAGDHARRRPGRPMESTSVLTAPIELELPHRIVQDHRQPLPIALGVQM